MEPVDSLWYGLFNGNEEEIILGWQSLFFWMLTQMKHLVFHLGWVEIFAKIEHLLVARDEFWLFPQTPVGAALAILGDLPDRRYFFLPQVQRYHAGANSLEAILILLALNKKNEKIALRALLESCWQGKSAIHPAVAENPERPAQGYYILTSWDAALVQFIDLLSKN